MLACQFVFDLTVFLNMANLQRLPGNKWGGELLSRLIPGNYIDIFTLSWHDSYSESICI